MSVLKWDQIGERLYQTGVKKGVLYLQSNAAYPSGVAWNGLTEFTESPDGAEATDLYADDIKYLSLRSVENFKCTIGCYMYPPEFEECNGEKSLIAGVTIGQQPRKPFGFSCVTTIGNDVEYDDYGYIIHLVYGCTASPSEENHQTVNDSPEAVEFSFEIDTVPTAVTAISGCKPTAHIEIDSTKVTKAQLTAIEAVLYGSDGEVSYDEFTGSTLAAETDYYERTGTENAYVYTKTTDTTMQSGKTYYTKTVTGATEARLPLPDEVISILQRAAA